MSKFSLIDESARILEKDNESNLEKLIAGVFGTPIKLTNNFIAI